MKLLTGILPDAGDGDLIKRESMTSLCQLKKDLKTEMQLQPFSGIKHL